MWDRRRGAITCGRPELIFAAVLQVRGVQNRHGRILREHCSLMTNNLTEGMRCKTIPSPERHFVAAKNRPPYNLTFRKSEVPVSPDNVQAV